MPSPDSVSNPSVGSPKGEINTENYQGNRDLPGVSTEPSKRNKHKYASTYSNEDLEIADADPLEWLPTHKDDTELIEINHSLSSESSQPPSKPIIKDNEGSLEDDSSQSSIPHMPAKPDEIQSNSPDFGLASLIQEERQKAKDDSSIGATNDFFHKPQEQSLNVKEI